MTSDRTELATGHSRSVVDRLCKPVILEFQGPIDGALNTVGLTPAMSLMQLELGVRNT